MNFGRGFLFGRIFGLNPSRLKSFDRVHYFIVAFFERQRASENIREPQTISDNPKLSPIVGDDWKDPRSISRVGPLGSFHQGTSKNLGESHRISENLRESWRISAKRNAARGKS